MKVSQQIRVLCAHLNISMAELARMTGQSPQNLNSKMKRESFTVSDLQSIAETLGIGYESHFILPNNEKV